MSSEDFLYIYIYISRNLIVYLRKRKVSTILHAQLYHLPNHTFKKLINKFRS